MLAIAAELRCLLSEPYHCRLNAALRVSAHHCASARAAIAEQSWPNTARYGAFVLTPQCRHYCSVVVRPRVAAGVGWLCLLTVLRRRSLLAPELSRSIPMKP